MWPIIRGKTIVPLTSTILLLLAKAITRSKNTRILAHVLLYLDLI